jgi:hypothetical protein
VVTGGIPVCGDTTGMQAVSMIANRKENISLLNTPGVYHKMQPDSGLLNPSEYVPAHLPIHSFTGKIAGYLPWRNK